MAQSTGGPPAGSRERPAAPQGSAPGQEPPGAADSVTVALVPGPQDGFIPYEQLTFASDFLFGSIMRDRDICAGVIGALLSLSAPPDLSEPEWQAHIKGTAPGRAVRLDIRASTPAMELDVEMQRQNASGLPERSRFYQAAMDAERLQAGQRFTDLKQNIILFLCLRDPFGRGLPVYTFTNRCHEAPGLELGDGTKKAFYNCSAYAKLEGKEELRALMEYVATGRATTPLTIQIDGKVIDARRNEHWLRDYLDMKQEEAEREYQYRRGKQEGHAEGGMEKAAEIARRMLAKKQTVAEVTDITGLTEAQVRQLAARA